MVIEPERQISAYDEDDNTYIVLQQITSIGYLETSLRVSVHKLQY